MRQRLAQVFQVPADLDYVEAFQALAMANLAVRRDGPSVQNLLHKARMEHGVGNHGASLGAVQRALELDPANVESRYELGLAYFFLALARAEALPVGPRPTDLPPEGIGELLGLAVEAFSSVIQLNPEDQDAADDLDALAEVLAVGADDEQLGVALRSL
ncbi:MAG: tetratricopeptide repeat protein [Thermoplasmatota archaeon]